MRVTANTAAVRNYHYPVTGHEFDRVMHEAANAARAVKAVTLVAAAPFIGLAYVVALPVLGLAAMAWLGLKALAARSRLAGKRERAPPGTWCCSSLRLSWVSPMRSRCRSSV